MCAAGNNKPRHIHIHTTTMLLILLLCVCVSLTIHPVWPSVAHESNKMVRLCVVHDAEVANGIFLILFICVKRSAERTLVAVGSIFF